MTGPGDVKDTEVQVRLGTAMLGTFPVTTTVQPALPGFDEAGTASVSVTLPAGVASGAQSLVVTGVSTGTELEVPIVVAVKKTTPTMTLKAPKVVKKNARPTVRVTLKGASGAVSGKVTFRYKGKTVTRTLSGGKASLQLAKLKNDATVKVTYTGNASYNTVKKSVTIRVRK